MWLGRDLRSLLDVLKPADLSRKRRVEKLKLIKKRRASKKDPDARFESILFPRAGNQSSSLEDYIELSLTFLLQRIYELNHYAFKSVNLC